MLPSEITNPYVYDPTKVGKYLSGSSTEWNTKEQNSIARGYEQYLLASQWQADQDRWLAELEYNSIPNQVEQYRQAGLNPDLIGLDYSPTSAPASDLSGNGAISGNSPLPLIFDSVNTVLNSVGQIASLEYQFQQRKLLKEQTDYVANQNYNSKLAQIPAERRILYDYFINTNSKESLESWINADIDPSTQADGTDINPAQSITIDADAFSAYTGLSPEDSKRITSQFHKNFQSLPFRKQFMDDLSSYVALNQAQQNISGTPEYSPTTIANSFNQTRLAAEKGLNKIMSENKLAVQRLLSSNRYATKAADAEISGLDAVKSENEYLSEYYNTLDPAAAATAANEQAEFNKLAAEMQQYFLETGAAYEKQSQEYSGDSGLLNMALMYYSLARTMQYSTDIKHFLGRWFERTLSGDFINDFKRGLDPDYYNYPQIPIQ